MKTSNKTTGITKGKAEMTKIKKGANKLVVKLKPMVISKKTKKGAMCK